MAGITLAQAQTKLDNAIAALDKAMEATRYKTPGGAEVQRDLAGLQNAVTFWDSQVKRLSRGGIRLRGGTPV